MTTEFKEAITDLYFLSSEHSSEQYHCYINKHGEAIQRALKIADRLMQEPSDAMAFQAYDEIFINKHFGYDDAAMSPMKDAFKAMTKQMLTEIDQ